MKNAIDKANGEQAQALAKNDPTIMKDTATNSYYQELAQNQAQMQQQGVSSIKLVSTQWGAVSVNGNTAKATTTETWQTTFSDGTTQEDTAQNDYTLTLQNGSWLIQSDNQDGGGNQPAPGSGGSTASASDSQSSNWSGYAADGGNFTSVNGSWTVPQVSANSPVGSADAAWVGIGGSSSDDLIQAGTEASVDGRGNVSYQAWVELLPQPSQQVSLSVSPGDFVTVSISEQGTGTWLISMTDQTTGQRYQTTVQYNSSHSSAEWIEEAPSLTGGRTRIVTLDNFGQIQFSNATATENGKQVSIAGAGGRSITMYGRTGLTAVPSGLTANGDGFTVTRTSNGV